MCIGKGHSRFLALGLMFRLFLLAWEWLKMKVLYLQAFQQDPGICNRGFLHSSCKGKLMANY